MRTARRRALAETRIRAIPGLKAYRALGGRSAEQSPDMPVPTTSGPVWLHATDPGEHDALKILAAQLADLHDAPECLVTGSSVQSGPGEEIRAIDAWLERIQPRMIVLAGAVLPPNLIERARGRGIALMLVNARNSAPPGHWRLWPGFTRALLGAFTQIHARDPDTVRGLSRLLHGAVPVLGSGSLARFPPAPGCNHAELEAIRDTLGGRAVWFAYSLPQAEAEAALKAHAHALRRSHRLLMIIAPRDPRDGEALAGHAVAMGFACARRTPDDEITETTQVYIADAEDEPGLFLRLSPVSYLGGSLTRDIATPGPLAAAALGSALVFGPHAEPADRAFLEQLRRVGGGRRIAVAEELGEAVSALLSPEIGAEAALRAWTLATEGSDATYHLARAICDWLQLNRPGAP